LLFFNLKDLSLLALNFKIKAVIGLQLRILRHIRGIAINKGLFSKVNLAYVLQSIG